jgi:cell division septation protein DedD
MRVLLSMAFLLGVSTLTGGLLTGCSTDEPGAQYTLNTYTANVDASPDKVTVAAQKAVADLKLTNINSSGTKVDGKVTAYTAQNSEVTINIEQAGDNVSKVSIQVGATGDQATSAQLMDRIKAHLSWF